ncbi:MAG TPA: efflux RND transporter periplasmic adaptor subunit [Thermoanaerobaculia bacterium]|nr:efflux RND transporter periplasmic adaptor subunit [Thermoanaerobaculia bacterium]
MRSVPVLLLGAALAAALSGCSEEGAHAAAQGEGGNALVAHRGTFRQRLLLSGELEAERGEPLSVPRTDQFQLQIRWLAEDGTAVKAGDRVVEFDNSQFASALEEKRLSASDAGSELQRTAAESKTGTADKRFAVEKARSEEEKARIAAAVPKDLLALREYQDRQLALKRAETELAKAQEDLDAATRGGARDVDVKKIALEKSQREIHSAEGAIDALTLRAPRAGMVLIGDHPWEGRKVRVGDTVWVGMTVASLPDLSAMSVQASLSDVDDGRIQPGMEVLCTLDAYPERVFKGRVADISPVARESRRSPLLRYFPVHVKLDRSDPRRMRPGMSVRVEVLGAELKDVLLVPRAALDFGGTAGTAGSPRALLASGGTVPVKLGACAALECVVESGLSEGTRLRSRNDRDEPDRRNGRRG